MSYFEKSAKFMRRQGFVFLFALLVGLASAAPYILAQNALRENYQGFPFLAQQNEDYYLARVQEVIDGHWLASSPYVYESKNSLSPIFPIGEYLYAWPALLFGVSASSMMMVTKFIFPALFFLLIYVLVYNLSKRTRVDKITAIFGGLLITMGVHLVNYKDAWSILMGQSTDYLSVWTRPVNPITGALFLFIFLILLWKSINSDKWYLPVATGVVLGLMPGYIFSWMMALAVLGAYAILLLACKRFEVIKRLFLIILSSTLISAPSWYLWFRSLFATEDGQYTASRFGLMLTHSPTLSKVVLAQTVFFLALFLFERRKKKKNNEKFEEWWWFAAALVIGNWLVLNQQIITGRVVWAPHLTQYTVPLAFLTFILILGNYLKAHATRLWVAIIVMGCSIVLLFVVMSTFSFNYSGRVKEFSELQRFMPFFVWLDKQAPKDCVVLAKEEEGEESLSRWIPAFTHCNVYSGPYAFVPFERTYFNYLVNLRLLDIKKQDLEQYLWNNKVGLRALFYTDWSQLFIPAGVKADDGWLLGPIQTLVDGYDALLKEDFAAALKRYRVDYLASEEPLSASLIKQLPHVELIGKFGAVFVYQFETGP